MMLERAFQPEKNTPGFSSKPKPFFRKKWSDFQLQSKKFKESTSQTSSMRAILIDTWKTLRPMSVQHATGSTHRSAVLRFCLHDNSTIIHKFLILKQIRNRFCGIYRRINSEEVILNGVRNISVKIKIIYVNLPRRQQKNVWTGWSGQELLIKIKLYQLHLIET